MDSIDVVAAGITGPYLLQRKRKRGIEAATKDEQKHKQDRANRCLTEKPAMAYLYCIHHIAHILDLTSLPL